MGKEILTVRQTAYEKQMDWMEKAIQEGALSKLPYHTTQKRWEKQQDIGITYTFGDVTLDDLGQIHGCTKENIRQLKENFVINLWGNSSPPLQAKYPLREISLTKPRGQKSREKSSELHGGISLRIKKAMKEQGIAVVGVNDIDNITNAARITKLQLSTSRPVLKNWGINMRRFDTPYADFAQKARSEEDDKKLQEFLDSFSFYSLKGFLQNDSNHETLTKVSIIANKKGFHAHTKRLRFIAQKIKEAEIPIIQIVHSGKNGKLLSSHHIVYSKHTERIAEVLSQDPDLQRFR